MKGLPFLATTSTIRNASASLNLTAKARRFLSKKTAAAEVKLCRNGPYFYDHHVCEYAKQVKPSARGELEITDLNKIYLEKGKLDVVTLGRGYAWLDTGTVDSLSEASSFVKAVENRAGIQIAALEDIAYGHGWITKEVLEESAEKYGKSPYGQYLKKVAEGRFLRDE